MKKIKSLLIIPFFFLLLSSSFVRADTPAENLYTGKSAFYIFSMDVNSTIQINLNHSGSGVFELYLLNVPPQSENINENSSIVVGTYTPDRLQVNYNATASALYFLQVKLIDNGPDVFWLSAIRDSEDIALTRYYIPQISGFPVEIMVITFFIGISVIYIIKKKVLNN
ncbi:MAG: hypothetical protein ACFFAS_02685 [Promethearchaeota archaeon]